MLFVLTLIEASEKSEWEVLDSLYSRFKLTPGGKEFRRILETLVGGGYVAFAPAGGTRNLRITSAGVKLLRRLQDEYKSIVSNIGEAQVS